MKSNVGKTDKILRLSAGAVIAGAGIAFQSWWGLVAIVPIGTALVGFCPLYPIFGISTCKNDAVDNTNGDSSKE